MKKYYYSTNKKKRALSCLIYETAFSAAFILIVTLITSALTYFFKNPNFIIGSLRILPFILIFFVIRTAHQLLSKNKGVILCDGYMLCLSSRKRIKIEYKNIVNIKSLEEDTVPKFDFKNTVFIGGSQGSYVKISLKSGRNFHLPIIDKDDFINDVLMRCDIQNNSAS